MILDTLDKLVDEIGDLVKQASTLAKMNKELLDKQECKWSCEKEAEPTLEDLREMARYIVDTDDNVLGITIKVTKARKKVKDEDDDLIADLYGKDDEKGGEE